MRMIFNQFKTYSLSSSNIFLERFDSVLIFLFNFSFCHHSLLFFAEFTREVLQRGRLDQ